MPSTRPESRPKPAGRAYSGHSRSGRFSVGDGHARALASVAVDVRVTQMVNQVVGAHAVLPPDALRP